MLERLRHYHPHTYRQLLAMARDFNARGPLYQQVRSSYGLSEAEFVRIAGNVRQAAALLQSSCRAGQLRFDLDPEAVVRGQTSTEVKVDCDNS